VIHAAAGNAPSELYVNASDVLQLVAVLVAAMVIIVTAYRAMQRPRLVLHEASPQQFRANRRDFWQYVVSMPLLMILWSSALEVILLFTNNALTAQEIGVTAVSIVVAVRLFAHVSHEHAHELAKSVPLTIVTLLIVTANGWRSGTEFDRTLHDWLNTTTSGPTDLVLVGSEFMIAAIWYWLGVRWWYARGHDVPGLPRQTRAVDPEHDLAERVSLRHSD
jgi:uncharacterized membrane protein YhaH (DUF805 family)